MGRQAQAGIADDPRIGRPADLAQIALGDVDRRLLAARQLHGEPVEDAAPGNAQGLRGHEHRIELKRLIELRESGTQTP